MSTWTIPQLFQSSGNLSKKSCSTSRQHGGATYWLCKQSFYLSHLIQNLKRQWNKMILRQDWIKCWWLKQAYSSNRNNAYKSPAGYSQHSVVMKNSIRKPMNKQVRQWVNLWIPNNSGVLSGTTSTKFQFGCLRFFHWRASSSLYHSRQWHHSDHLIFIQPGPKL